MTLDGLTKSIALYRIARQNSRNNCRRVLGLFIASFAREKIFREWISRLR
jgi:hypothetical protein